MYRVPKLRQNRSCNVYFPEQFIFCIFHIIYFLIFEWKNFPILPILCSIERSENKSVSSIGLVRWAKRWENDENLGNFSSEFLFRIVIFRMLRDAYFIVSMWNLPFQWLVFSSIKAQFGFPFIGAGTRRSHRAMTCRGRRVTHKTTHTRLFADWGGRFSIGHRLRSRASIGVGMVSILVLMAERQLHVTFRPWRRLFLHRKHVGEHTKAASEHPTLHLLPLRMTSANNKKSLIMVEGKKFVTVADLVLSKRQSRWFHKYVTKIEKRLVERLISVTIK